MSYLGPRVMEVEERPETRKPFTISRNNPELARRQINMIRGGDVVSSPGALYPRTVLRNNQDGTLVWESASGPVICHLLSTVLDATSASYRVQPR